MKRCDGCAGLAVLVELLSEPFLIVSLVWLRFDLKFWVEGGATVVRSAITAIFLYSTKWWVSQQSNALVAIGYKLVVIWEQGLLLLGVLRRCSSIVDQV